MCECPRWDVVVEPATAAGGSVRMLRDSARGPNGCLPRRIVAARALDPQGGAASYPRAAVCEAADGSSAWMQVAWDVGPVGPAGYGGGPVPASVPFDADLYLFSITDWGPGSLIIFSVE